MSRSAKRLWLCALLLGAAAGCNAPDPLDGVHVESSRAKLAVPPAIAAVAAAALGPDARVIFFGDLARNGRQQVLAASGTAASSNIQRGVGFTRAAVLEQVGTKWVEVLRCDEYLKNPSGYLIGTPREPVTSWRLEFGANSGDYRQDLLFTPREPSGASSRTMSTVSVRWNPSANRYQSVDPESGHFLAEVSSLETPVVPLR
jgi:hypothetical protein